MTFNFLDQILSGFSKIWQVLGSIIWLVLGGFAIIWLVLSRFAYIWLVLVCRMDFNQRFCKING